jgi:hypothetical protein
MARSIFYFLFSHPPPPLGLRARLNLCLFSLSTPSSAKHTCRVSLQAALFSCTPPTSSSLALPRTQGALHAYVGKEPAHAGFRWELRYLTLPHFCVKQQEALHVYVGKEPAHGGFRWELRYLTLPHFCVKQEWPADWEPINDGELKTEKKLWLENH